MRTARLVAVTACLLAWSAAGSGQTPPATPVIPDNAGWSATMWASLKQPTPVAVKPPGLNASSSGTGVFGAVPW